MKLRSLTLLAAVLVVLGLSQLARAWDPKPVKDDPLLRMPGTQPEQGVALEAPNRCLNCHAGYALDTEPGHNWKGSMMAQAARDPMWFACMTVSIQDSIHALGNANATDLCIRCHSPSGWLGGRSDPTNASALSGDDHDGVHCDACHRMWDPFFQSTHAGLREGSDWSGYWDEASSLSSASATATRDVDRTEAAALRLFSGGALYAGDAPVYADYTEHGGGQYYASADAAKRASFADAAARHQTLYSRHHKSKHFCQSCHDVSNPVLANLGLSDLPDLSGGVDQISEQYAPYRYFHVERTSSEFLLSAYGRDGGAATNPEFRAQGAPDIGRAAKCQDCHMRDVSGAGCDKRGVPLRPSGSAEHPRSGLPLHDLTGGNAWISHILASLDPLGPVYDPINDQLLGQGAAVLTLDLSAGISPLSNGAALKAGSDRAVQQLKLAATVKELGYDPATGALAFKVQNNTGHKLISGFPEGRRLFVQVQAYAAGDLIYEVNPYDAAAGTLKGLPHVASSPELGAHEVYDDALVYEAHMTSALTGEQESFHFVLATGRYKDNRIPPKGFDIDAAAARHSVPVAQGVERPDLYSAEEYAGGYDAVSLSIAPGADYVRVAVMYQGTSREYIEFLRDEINGDGATLPASAYIAQSDPFFAALRAWGSTIWELWRHNHGLDGLGAAVPGIVPVEVHAAAWGHAPAPPCLAPAAVTGLSATSGKRRVDLRWQPSNAAGYLVFYDQAGKRQLIGETTATSFRDSGLTRGVEHCYVVAGWTDCDGDGAFNTAVDTVSAASAVACAAAL